MKDWKGGRVSDAPFYGGIPVLDQYWSALTKQLAKEEGEACDHWVDAEKICSLETREERVAYILECYDVCVTMPPSMDRATIRCASNDFKRASLCSNKFEKTQVRFVKEMAEKLAELKKTCQTSVV